MEQSTNTIQLHLAYKSSVPSSNSSFPHKVPNLDLMSSSKDGIIWVQMVLKGLETKCTTGPVALLDRVHSQYERIGLLTSQKNSLPLNPQNQEIHETSSELLIVQDL